MRLIPRKEQNEPATAATRVFNFERELAAAGKTALAPLRERLLAYSAEADRLRECVARWSPETYQTKVGEIRRRAVAGDAEAAQSIEDGKMPSASAYAAMHGTALGELALFTRTNLGLFREALPLLVAALPPVHQAAQANLDETLDNLGVPRFRLRSAEGRVNFILREIELAGQPGNLPDISWVWQILEA